MADDDFYKIEFLRNEKVNKFLEELDLKEGNMYIILKPEDKINFDVEKWFFGGVELKKI